MSEHAGRGERVMALTMLKLGGMAVTTAALSAAATWAARRAKFEHTIGRFTDQVAFLESDAADHHDAISRHVAAASLLRPEGVTRDQLRGQLRYGGVDQKTMGMAVHSLVTGEVLERAMVNQEHLVRPTESFMLALLDQPERAPRLLAAARMLDGPDSVFQFEDLRPFVPSVDVLDTRPLDGGADTSGNL
jgi:hypothetical protein